MLVAPEEWGVYPKIWASWLSSASDLKDLWNGRCLKICISKAVFIDSCFIKITLILKHIPNGNPVEFWKINHF